MRVVFVSNWRTHRRDGLNPIRTFVLFNVWWSRHDSRGIYGFPAVIGLEHSLGFLFFNFGAEVTW